MEFLKRLYEHFNAREMESVLAAMHEDVMWANGMEGGHVHGRDAVRAYWTRQWAMIDPRVDPVDWVERIPISETRNYVARIMENLQVYRARFGGGTKLVIEADIRKGGAH